MDMRKSAIYLLVGMLCINGWSMMLYEVGISGEVAEPSWNQTAMEENLDANATLTYYSWDIAYSDFVTGTLKFIGVVWGLVVGFPQLLSSSGVPGFIVDPLYIIWMFLWFGTVLMYWIGGREI